RTRRQARRPHARPGSPRAPGGAAPAAVASQRLERGGSTAGRAGASLCLVSPPCREDRRADRAPGAAERRPVAGAVCGRGDRRPDAQRLQRGSGRAVPGAFFQLRRAFYFILRSLAGECESMRKLRESLWNNVFTHDMRGYDAALWNRMEDFSTLLLGETGTGKGQAAAAIGRSEFIPYLPAERRFAANFTETFIAINLSQFPETLIES